MPILFPSSVSMILDLAALSSNFISSLVKVINFLVLSAELDDMNSIST